MTNILISLNGNCSAERTQLLEDYNLVFGVDGGTEYLYKLFFQPTHIIGDFDSINENTKSRAIRDGAKILAFNSEKDQTDLEIALEEAKKNNADCITIIGGEGKELDHLFSNLLNISSFNEDEAIKWITKDENIIFSNQEKYNIVQGSTFSILPLSDLKNITIKGSKWDIENLDIPYGSSRTLRNVAMSSQLTITLEKGRYCLIIKN
tara:strand:- start:6606 stop:7226 length:621 start_codon:yes stop_codon:yes gene_type:complete